MTTEEKVIRVLVTLGKIKMGNTEALSFDDGINYAITTISIWFSDELPGKDNEQE